MKLNSFLLLLSLLITTVFTEIPDFMRADLNSTQINKINQILDSFEKENQLHRVRTSKHRLAVKEQLLYPKPDLKEIRLSLIEIGKSRSEITFNEIKRDLAIKKILSPEQFQKWISHHKGKRGKNLIRKSQ